MPKLLIIADDFTGALDTAVAFAVSTATIKVITPPLQEWSKHSGCLDVLIIDAETRHLTPADAYETVAGIVRQAVRMDIPYIFKKTDSALRGNVGAELAAVLRESGRERLAFLPAYPQMNRFTINAEQYIENLPVAQSVFGQDPFEPVLHSKITELIGSQSDVPVHTFPALNEETKLPDEEGILVFDASTREDLEKTVGQIMAQKQITLLAGCGGLANVLPELFGFEIKPVSQTGFRDARLTVVSGSVNQITLNQLDHAQRHGFARYSLTPEQRLTEGYWRTEAGRRTVDAINEMVGQHNHSIVDVSDGVAAAREGDVVTLGMDDPKQRTRVADSLGHIVHSLLNNPETGTLLITGGDTLFACMRFIGINELEPLGELAAGVVLSRFNYDGRWHEVITKSGGFGEVDLLTNIVAQRNDGN